MSSKGGPSITTDGLVLSLDAANIKSFPGKPTTNHAPSSLGDWGTEGTSERIATGRTYKGQPTYNCRTQVGAVWIGIYNSISGLRTSAGSGGTVTMSCFIRNNNSSSYNCTAYIGHDFSSTRSIAANSGWQKIQWTVNQSSMNDDYVEFRPYTNNASIYLEMTMPQVEVNIGSATRFTSGTRGTTDAWKDRSGNNNHGDILNGVDTADDDTAEESLNFDNTNDYIQLPNDLGYTSSAVSVFCWYKINGNPAGNYHILCGGQELELSINVSHSYIRNGLRTTSGRFVQNDGNVSLNDGNWHFYGFTYDGSTKRTYIDGVQVGTQAITGTLTTSFTRTLGRFGSSTSYFANGKMAKYEVYSRSLSASEVLQNYNATKGRYGL